VRDVYMCDCGHPASEVVLDLNTHNMTFPHACHVDNCKCQGYKYAGPFYRRSESAPTAMTPTGRFGA
jgi:hypothetical protein